MRSIGVEAINLDEFKTDIDRRGSQVLSEMFTDEERETCLLSRRSIAAFAGLKAAKEALLKALPSVGNESGFTWRDLEVERVDASHAKFRLAGRLLEHLRRIGVNAIHLSMSSTHDNALAFVVVE